MISYDQAVQLSQGIANALPSKDWTVKVDYLVVSDATYVKLVNTNYLQRAWEIEGIITNEMLMNFKASLDVRATLLRWIGYAQALVARTNVSSGTMKGGTDQPPGFKAVMVSERHSNVPYQLSGPGEYISNEQSLGTSDLLSTPLEEASVALTQCLSMEPDSYSADNGVGDSSVVSAKIPPEISRILVDANQDPIRIGDLLTTEGGHGFVVKALKPKTQKIVGVAMENYNKVGWMIAKLYSPVAHDVVKFTKGLNGLSELNLNEKIAKLNKAKSWQSMSTTELMTTVSTPIGGGWTSVQPSKLDSGKVPMRYVGQQAMPSAAKAVVITQEDPGARMITLDDEDEA